jgi:hypothetical protein
VVSSSVNKVGRAYTVTSRLLEPFACANACKVSTGCHLCQYDLKGSVMSRTPNPERESPHTGVEVDIQGGATSNHSRVVGASHDAQSSIGQRVSAGLSGDEARSEGGNGESKEA